MTFAYLLVALVAADQTGESQGVAPPPSLVFEFPDGARGGHGKIQGTGALPDAMMPDFYLEQIRKCGAGDARYSDVQATHRIMIVASSTDQDREIVGCVQRSVPHHFSVYAGSASIFSGSRDDAPFRDFWSPRPAPAEKVE